MDIIKFIAGLINENVDAPTKPAIRPGTAPSKPKQKPAFKPFNPPRPAKQPQPKAKQRPLGEAFEQDANPGTVNFWRNIRSADHPFQKHPLLAMYGYESASKAFEHGIQKLIAANPQMQNMGQRQAIAQATSMAMQAVQQASRLEQPHIEKLQALAIKAVSQAWGVPEDMLQARITTDFGGMQDDTPDEFDLWGEEEIEDTDLPASDDLRHQINKRITFNALTQGAAVHNMATLHHVVAKELEAISPQLLDLYQKFSSGATSMYWMMDFVSITKAALRSSVVGTSHVEYNDAEQADQEAEPQTEEPEAPNATVVGLGFNFPVVIQELVKGVMELLSHHGLANLDAKQLDKIYAEADRLEDEPWLIQVGPHLWRAFLKIVPKGSQLAEVVANLALQEPKYVHDLLAKTIEAVHRGEDPAEAREELARLLQGEEDEEPGFEPSADYGDEPDFGDDEYA